MERKVLAALDLEGKQDRGSDSERRGYPEERPRGVCGEQAEGDRSYGEHEVDQRHHGDHTGIGWDEAHQEAGIAQQAPTIAINAMRDARAVTFMGPPQ